jgi:hypothetical protein
MQWLFKQHSCKHSLHGKEKNCSTGFWQMQGRLPHGHKHHYKQSLQWQVLQAWYNHPNHVTAWTQHRRVGSALRAHQPTLHLFPAQLMIDWLRHVLLKVVNISERSLTVG